MLEVADVNGNVLFCLVPGEVISEQKAILLLSGGYSSDEIAHLFNVDESVVDGFEEKFQKSVNSWKI